MKNNKLILYAVVSAVSVFIYVSAVAWGLFNGERLFGKVESFWGPVVILLLFVLSATITGALILGRPIYLYLNNSKREAVKLLIYTVVSLLVITLITIATRLVG